MIIIIGNNDCVGHALPEIMATTSSTLLFSLAGWLVVA
jgi:hypothetical protein